MIQTLEETQNSMRTFFEIAAHRLAIPTQAALTDAYNLWKENGTRETKHLLNAIQGLRLLVQNILHEDGSKITQEGDAEFVKKPITESIYAVCEMFKAEAEAKGCDLRVSIGIGNDIFSFDNINDLKDINIIYKKVICEKFSSFPKSQAEQWRFIVRSQNDGNSKKMNISELVEHCHKINSCESFDVFDAVTKRKIEFDFSKLSNYYLSPVEMNSYIIDRAFESLTQNAVKYSYKAKYGYASVMKKFITIQCYFNRHNVTVVFKNYGVGITEKEIKEGKIWLPRYRGYLSQEWNRTGAGLGLTDAKWAIEEVHKGEITCESKRTDGDAYITKFIVKLNYSQSLN